jgi:hypothetical protein
MDEPEMKIIDVFICKLRKKLEKLAEGDSSGHVTVYDSLDHEISGVSQHQGAKARSPSQASTAL